MAGSAFGGPARVHKAGQRSRLFVRARHVAPLPAASILRTSVVRNTPKSRISSYPQPRKGVNERAFAAGLAEAPATVLASRTGAGRYEKGARRFGQTGLDLSTSRGAADVAVGRSQAAASHPGPNSTGEISRFDRRRCLAPPGHSSRLSYTELRYALLRPRSCWRTTASHRSISRSP